MKRLLLIIALTVVLITPISCRDEDKYNSATYDILGGATHELVKISVEKFEDWREETTKSSGFGFFFLIGGGGSNEKTDNRIERTIEIVFAVKLNADNSIVYLRRPINDIRFNVSNNPSATFLFYEKSSKKEIPSLGKINAIRTKIYQDCFEYFTGGVFGTIINVPQETINDVLSDVFYMDYHSTVK